MTIEFKDLGNIESFYGNFNEPEGYGTFDDQDEIESKIKGEDENE